MPKKKVLISGAGPAGLAAAILLDQDKYEITVIERGPTFMNMGFSIILWQPGFDVLAKVLGTKNIDGLWPLNTFSVYGGEKVKLLQSADSTGIGFSIERKVLIEQLSKKYLQVCGDKSIKFNTSIKDTEFAEDMLQVTFTDGTKDNYDILIAADGMHSYSRMGNIKAELTSNDYKIAYGWVEPGSKLHDEAIVGYMKNYAYLIQTVDDKALLAYYHHSDSTDNSAFLDTIKHQIESQRGGTFTFDTKTAQTFMSEELRVKKPYNRNIVLVGDAYHGHPPTLGMGTSMALGDSCELAQLLNNINTGQTFMRELNDAFITYTKKRKKEIAKTYDTQDRIDAMIFTTKARRVALTTMIIKYGGWNFIEPLLRDIFSGSK